MGCFRSKIVIYSSKMGIITIFKPHLMLSEPTFKIYAVSLHRKKEIFNG